MLTDELEHRIGTSRSLSSVEIKQADHEEIDRLTAEFLAKGNQIYYARPNESAEDAKRFFNNQGVLNPAKYRSKYWSVGGLNGKSQIQSTQ